MSDKKPDLPDRAQLMLRSLIDRYVRDGQPVGSRTLARELGLDLSPATIRNVMSDLEALGFVSSPHTSAGRVPTVQGYRFFVDTLLTVQPLDSRSIEKMRLELSLEGTPKNLVESASGLLSGITHMAGVVTLPSHAHALFKRVEFLSLSENRVLAILVTGEDESAKPHAQDRETTQCLRAATGLELFECTCSPARILPRCVRPCCAKCRKRAAP